MFFAAVGAEGVRFCPGFFGRHGELPGGADDPAAVLAAHEREGFAPDRAGVRGLCHLYGAGGTDVGAAAAADANGIR